MSWLFSQALVEEYLGDTCSDGEPSAPSSGNPTQLAYLSPDKMTVFSRLSRFGMTFKPLTADRGEELLTSYLEAFPARTSQPLGKGLGLTESGQECGEKWHASFVKYDQNSCLWKTHQCSLLGDLEPFSETWPQWGLMRGGECWEQQMSALRIRETASGLWPTPVKSDFAARRPSKGWKGTDLPSVVWTRSGGKENPNKPPVKLNPKWVSWLMGWPLEWTNLRPLEMDKFRLWQQQHGAS
jgi:hypothetical protein